MIKKTIGKLTFQKTKRLLKPALWIFFEDFSNTFPSILIFIAIYEISNAFESPNSISFQTLLLFSALLLVLAVIQFFIGFKAFRTRFLSSSDYVTEDRMDFVKKLRRLPLGFFSKKEKGELINNFVTDFVNLQQAMTGVLSGLFSVVLSCLLTSVGMFIYNPPMAVAFYIAMPITALLLVLSMKTLEKNSVRVAAARDKAATNLNEYLGGMRTLKSYNQTGEGFTKLKNAYHHLMESYIKEESGSGSLMRLCTSLVQFGLPLMCMTGGYLLVGGKFGLVEFISIIIIGTKILTPVVLAVSNMMILRSNYVSAKRLDTTMKESEMGGNEVPVSDSDIRFENVSFAYTAGGNTVLKNMSFTLPKGKLTAIAGPSGSGKSTILRLIARFWDASAGAIIYGGKPITTLSPEVWQENISMVLQDVYLFHDTIRENILFGRKDATEGEMFDAARRAGCHDFIAKLPDGYDTMVGEGGSTLSGGEKQRISIARALLKKAPIVLLDEPTASLDAKNEALVQKAVSELVKNATVVMIAHRLKTIQNADQILILNEGVLEEQGVHNKLLAQKGLYNKLWQMQEQAKNWNIQKEQEN